VLRSECVEVFEWEEMMKRRSRCVGLLGEEVLGYLAEWDQYLVRVRWREIQRIPELEEPAPFQCRRSDRSLRNWTTHPSVGAQVEVAQGLGVDRVVEDPLVGVEMGDDQG